MDRGRDGVVEAIRASEETSLGWSTVFGEAEDGSWRVGGVDEGSATWKGEYGQSVTMYHDMAKMEHRNLKLSAESRIYTGPDSSL